MKTLRCKPKRAKGLLVSEVLRKKSRVCVSATVRSYRGGRDALSSQSSAVCRGGLGLGINALAGLGQSIGAET